MAYIEQRRNTGRWYALHDIPADVQVIVGKKRFFQSLGTADRTEAKARAAALEALWKRRIELARQAAQPQSSLDEKAFYWQEQIATASADEKAVLRGLVHEECSDLARPDELRSGLEPGEPGHAKLPSVVAANRYSAIANGKIARTDKHLDEYLASLQCEPKTAHMRASTIKTFCSAFPLTSDVQKKAVQRWVNELAQASKAPATIRRSLSELRGYWGYLQAIEAVPEESLPFDRLAVARSNKQSSEARRTAFSPHDVVRLHTVAQQQGDHALSDLITLAMWTGCRLEEVCSLSVDKVGPRAIQIEDAKTPAGWRQVPIHAALRPVLERLVKESKDGFILSGLTTNKFGDRSNAIGKRFGRLKTALGFGQGQVFHSIRRTVATLLEDAGVPENVSADILGHEKPRITYGLYSGGASLATKHAAMAKISYPAAT